MSVTYCRKEKCGICSSIYCLIVTLDVDKPDSIYVNVVHANYGNLRWGDLFVNEAINTSNRKDVTHRRYHPIYGRFINKEKIKDYHDTYMKYIKPKDNIMELIKHYINIYPIKESTALYFRGTDKHIESRRLNYEEYLDHIPESGPLYIQSDEKQFVDYMMEKFPDRAFYIKEFKFTNTNKPIHLGNNECNIKDAIEIVIITYLLAESNKFICCLSNVSNVSLVIRGTLDNCVLIS